MRLNSSLIVRRRRRRDRVLKLVKGLLEEL